MASVVRRKNSRLLTACFTNRDGRQLKRSTKTTDQRQALEIGLELERVERQARPGVLTTTQLKDDGLAQIRTLGGGRILRRFWGFKRLT
jgi:hypothetical protein